MRPTFDKKDVLLEVHLMDWSGDLYDQSLRVAFVDYIRPEMKFAGIEELTEQIAEDVKKARKILSNHNNRQTKYADKKVHS